MLEESPPRFPSSDAEETLDPQDWEALRALGHRMLDDMLDYLATVRERPVWQPPPPEVKAHFQGPPPTQPTTAEEVYAEFLQDVLPYPNGNIHPRFWGWVQGTGTPLAMLADMLASGMNPHLAGYDQSPTLVEQQVIAWIAELMGFPANSGGLLVSGGTVANLIGVAVARNKLAGFDIREEGLQGNAHPPLVLYGSTETHSWAQKAVELLGLGNWALRRIPVDSAYRVRLPELRQALQQDRRDGYRPFCVIGTAGTVNTGATDDLAQLADLCAEEKLWFHVDGAFGAWARLTASCRSVVEGVERADSLAVDLHKWLYMPFEAGCALVRDVHAQQETFTVNPSYLESTGRGIAAEPMTFASLGIDLSRGFRALKVWMSLKTHGVDAFARLIEQNIAQARYLTARIEADPHLELLAPAPLNVVCFRYRAPDLEEAATNALNEEILFRLQESGLAVPSSTRLHGRFALRVAITNHRSRWEDFDLLVGAVLKLGQELTG